MGELDLCKSICKVSESCDRWENWFFLFILVDLSATWKALLLPILFCLILLEQKIHGTKKLGEILAKTVICCKNETQTYLSNTETTLKKIASCFVYIIILKSKHCNLFNLKMMAYVRQVFLFFTIVLETQRFGISIWSQCNCRSMRSFIFWWPKWLCMNSYPMYKKAFSSFSS